MKLNSHKNWIIFVMPAAVVVIYVAVFFVPKLRNLEKMGQDLAAKRAFVEKSEKTAEALAEIEEKLAETTAYGKTWKKHAPRPGEISIVLGKISALAREANVAIDSFDPEPAETLDRVRLLPVSLECSGRLTEVFGFLSQLEQMPQTIWIKNVTIEGNNKRGKSENRGVTQCVLGMEIFMDNLDNSN